MKLIETKPNQTIKIGTKVIHKTTMEVGEVIDSCLGFGRCKVVYPPSKIWYPQPIRNIMIIEL